MSKISSHDLPYKHTTAGKRRRFEVTSLESHPREPWRISKRTKVRQLYKKSFQTQGRDAPQGNHGSHGPHEGPGPRVQAQDQGPSLRAADLSKNKSWTKKVCPMLGGVSRRIFPEGTRDYDALNQATKFTQNFLGKKNPASCPTTSQTACKIEN